MKAKRRRIGYAEPHKPNTIICEYCYCVVKSD